MKIYMTKAVKKRMAQDLIISWLGIITHDNQRFETYKKAIGEEAIEILVQQINRIAKMFGDEPYDQEWFK